MIYKTDIMYPVISTQEIVDKLSYRMDKERQERVFKSKKILVSNQEIYRQKASKGELYTLKPEDFYCGALLSEDFEFMYKDRLRDSKTGRPIYDKILSSGYTPSHCLYCTVRPSDEIDHFLPSYIFPQLYFEPYNLVPACKRCNNKKLKFFSQDAENEPFHPYFSKKDDLGVWLTADVIPSDDEEKPVAIRFKAIPEVNIDEITQSRIINYFVRFELKEKYAVSLAKRVTEINRCLRKNSLTAEEVSDYLLESAERLCVENENECEFVMYKALAHNDWYCQGGYGFG